MINSVAHCRPQDNSVTRSSNNVVQDISNCQTTANVCCTLCVLCTGSWILCTVNTWSVNCTVLFSAVLYFTVLYLTVCSLLYFTVVLSAWQFRSGGATLFPQKGSHWPVTGEVVIHSSIPLHFLHPFSLLHLLPSLKLLVQSVLTNVSQSARL